MKERFMTLYGVYFGKELISVHFRKFGALRYKSLFKKSCVKVEKINALQLAKFLIYDYIPSCSTTHVISCANEK